MHAQYERVYSPDALLKGNKVLMTRSLISAALFVSFTLSTFAQLPSQPIGSSAHQHPGLAPTQQIDGSVNPNGIADLTAYRMFLLVVAKKPDAKPEELAQENSRQQGHLHDMGISEQDSKLLIPILDEFRAKYASMIRDYNQYAEAKARLGEVADSASFIVQRDILVQATRDKLKALSFDAQSRFDTHVQHEKERMKTVVPVAR